MPYVSRDRRSKRGQPTDHDTGSPFDVDLNANGWTWNGSAWVEPEGE